jgi:hypothetical protein
VQNTLGVDSGLRLRDLKRGRSSTPPWTAAAVHNGEVHDCLGVTGGVRRWEGRLELAANWSGADLGQRLGGVVTEHSSSRSEERGAGERLGETIGVLVKMVKLMSMESKVNIVGSAKIRRNIYNSDYESFETVKGKTKNIMHNHFMSVFEIIKSVENTIITDFELGENSKGEPLRWTYEEIKRKDNNGITFEDALKQKSMIKMDIVTLHDGRFIEISEVYNIYID